MSNSNPGSRGRLLHRGILALGVSAGLAVPGALLAAPTAGAATPSAATSNPLGPTLTQVENFYAGAVANSDGVVATIKNTLDGLLPSSDELASLGCDLQNITYILPFYGGGPPPCAGYF
jgi:hypothetical protein